MPNKPFKHFFCRILPCLFSLVTFAQNQNIAIGQWRVHLPYNNIKSIAESGNNIFAVTTQGGMFSLNKTDNSIERHSKITGFSDHGFSDVAYFKEKGVLVVTYRNGNIDLVINNQITNLPDLKNKLLVGKKEINRIRFFNNAAYLATSFGILKIDLDKKAISETYIIGTNGTEINVYDVAATDTDIYAATENGVYSAPFSSPNLADFNYWKKEPLDAGVYNTIVNLSGKILTNRSLNIEKKGENKDTVFYRDSAKWKISPLPTYTLKKMEVINNKLINVYRYSVVWYDPNLVFLGYVNSYFGLSAATNGGIFDSEDNLWIGDDRLGLIKKTGAQTFETFAPNGPAAIAMTDLESHDGIVYAVAGIKDAAWTSKYNSSPLSLLQDNTWATKQLYPPAFDVLSVAVSDEKDIYGGSWGRGILQIKADGTTIHYVDTNSTLEDLQVSPNDFRVGAVKLDQDGNLWATNSKVSNKLVVKRTDGTWEAFPITTLNIPQDLDVGELIVTSNGQKWIQTRGSGVIVFDERKPDFAKWLTNSKGSGNLQSNEVHALSEDLNGEVWIGTDNGITVFYNPASLTAGPEVIDGQPVIIEQGGHVQHLMESQTVTTIEVDGGNRKWIGTLSSGVFLVSEDGSKELEHFTIDNSPLLSNEILDIEVDNKSGEVFFATAEGLISFKGTATINPGGCKEPYAYPNPVRPGYSGTIGIKDLMNNAEVKITDVAGNLVYSAVAEGGQAVWDGRDLSGNPVGSGVYIVLAINSEATSKCRTKILIVR